MTELLQKAIAELHKLPEQRQDEVAAWILEKLVSAPSETSDSDAEAEAEWEAAVLGEVLADALLPDGTIDFDKLDARTVSITLEELYPEGDDESST